MVALLTSAKFAGAVNGGSTSAFDSTGASIIIVARSSDWFTTNTVTDNMGNTYTLQAESPAPLARSQIWTSQLNPTVGSGHVVTSAAAGTYCSFVVGCFGAGVTNASRDQANGTNNTGASSIPTGSFTPAVDYELIVVCSANTNPAGAPTNNTGMTLIDYNDYQPGVSSGSNLFWTQQAAKTDPNTTVTYSGAAAGWLTAMGCSFFANAPGRPFSQGYIFG